MKWQNYGTYSIYHDTDIYMVHQGTSKNSMVYYVQNIILFGSFFVSIKIKLIYYMPKP